MFTVRIWRFFMLLSHINTYMRIRIRSFWVCWGIRKKPVQKATAVRPHMSISNTVQVWLGSKQKILSSLLNSFFPNRWGSVARMTKYSKILGEQLPPLPPPAPMTLSHCIHIREAVVQQFPRQRNHPTTVLRSPQWNPTDDKQLHSQFHPSPDHR